MKKKNNKIDCQVIKEGSILSMIMPLLERRNKMFDMADNYEERKVKNTEINGAIIDTCAVSDSEQPFETGILHPSYNNGGWVIVEMYDSKKDAKKGHEKWVKVFSGKSLPPELKDVSTAEIALLAKSVGCQQTFKKERKSDE